MIGIGSRADRPSIECPSSGSTRGLFRILQRYELTSDDTPSLDLPLNSLTESITMAFAALTANKMRAVLTTLGVVIGITTVLIMGWLLTGLDNALEQTLDIFGDDILYIDKHDWTGQQWMESRNRKNITYNQFLKVKQRLASPEYVLPTTRRGARSVEYGTIQITGTAIQGCTSEYNDMLGGAMAQGRFFTAVEDEAGAGVAVLGPTVAGYLFAAVDPIGKRIRIDGMPFVVVGIMPKRGALGVDFVDNQILIPIRKFFSMYGGNTRVTINVKAGGVDRVDEVRYETIGVMRQVRSLAPGQKDDFAVNTQQAFRDQTAQLRFIVFGVGLALTGLSFLVGSIGIMNIMFVSVTERTKEIGIRKALGATRSRILLQFLVEAIVLCLLGSLIALGITSIAAFFGANWLKETYDLDFLSPIIPPAQIGLAMFVSACVGVLAGIIPAYRGARMNPVDALRAE